MMSQFFIGTEDKHRVEFEDGQWVDVKGELTQEDQDYIVSQMAKAENVGKEAKFSMSLGRMALLERSVLDWSFTDDSGKPVPVNRENISRLRLRYRTTVLDEINRLNEEAGEFSKNSERAST